MALNRPVSQQNRKINYQIEHYLYFIFCFRCGKDVKEGTQGNKKSE